MLTISAFPGRAIERELADYLAGLAHTRFAYGSCDCATLMANWLVRLGYADPMADRRGSYCKIEEYLEAVASEGGFKKSCRNRFASIGLIRTRSPAAGDVALVLAPIGIREGKIDKTATGALCVTETMRAVMTGDMGIVVAPLPTIRAWKVVDG